MAMAATRDEVIRLERRFWDAMREKDAERTQEMTDDSCIVVGAQGVSSIDGPTMAKLTREGAWELEKYALDEGTAEVRFVGPDLAIVAYKVGERLTVDGETLHLDANDASVWVRRAGEWRCALHTESLAGDPFGRDRVARS